VYTRNIPATEGKKGLSGTVEGQCQLIAGLVHSSNSPATREDKGWLGTVDGQSADLQQNS